MKTQVINLFGGSGLGKSTTAAGLFYEMKLRGLHTELVREYIKEWAWSGQRIGPYDQAYIFGRQSRAESLLYGKVDYIVTDSPLLLSPIYESFYGGGGSVVASSALAFLDKVVSDGVIHRNFILERKKPFDTRGRYETEEQAKAVDVHVKAKLDDWGISYTVIECPDRERVEAILKEVGL